jgi:Zn-dependent protease
MNFDPGNFILSFVVFVFSLTLHEVGHAWTSEKFGDPTSRYLGRISLNPLVHMDPVGTVLLPLIGALTGLPVIGWAKPVPVNPLLWRDKTIANIAVSAAGPIANMIIAIVAFSILKILLYQGFFVSDGSSLGLADPSSINTAIFKLLFFFVIINIWLAVFNLIPIPPLDGSHILSSILSKVSPNLMDSYENIRPYGFIILLAFVTLYDLSKIVNPVIGLVIRLLSF